MAFSHRDAAFDLNAVLVVNDTVQNAFSNRAPLVFGPVTVDAVIPVIYIILGTEDQRPFLAAGINQFQEVIMISIRNPPGSRTGSTGSAKRA